MGIMDSFRKIKEKDQEHSTPPPKGHTVSEILQDKSKFHLFSKLLERDGQEELGKRLVEGKPEAEDLGLLSEYRIKFSEKIVQSEKIEALLTEENVIDIARKHPDFAKILDSATPKQVIRVIQNQLREICFADEDRFNAIAQPIEMHDSFKNGEHKEKEAKIEKFCKDNQISVKEYVAVIAIEDPREKEKAFRELSSRTYSGFKKAVNLVSGGKWAKDTTLQGLKDNETSIEDSNARLDNLKLKIGETLYLSVSGNDDMRYALGREINSEGTPTVAESKTGFGDMKKEAAGIFDEAKVDKDWESYKVRMAYDTSNDFEKGWVQAKFIDEQKEAYRKKNKKIKGFWASVLSAMFDGKINEKMNKLK